MTTLETLKVRFLEAHMASEIAFSEFQARSIEEGPCQVGDVVTVSPYGRAVIVRVTNASLRKTYSTDRFYVQYLGKPLKKDGGTALVGEKRFMDSDHIEIIARASDEAMTKAGAQ